jgi:hypothetical protein
VCAGCAVYPGRKPLGKAARPIRQRSNGGGTAVEFQSMASQSWSSSLYPSAESTQDLRRRVPTVVAVFFIADVLVVVLAVINYGVAHYLGIEHPSFLRLNAESNLPTWYSSFQHGVVAALFGCLAIREIRIDLRRWCIVLPALMFLFFSLDETAMVHDRIGDWFRARYPAASADDGANNAPAMMICAPLVILACVLIARWTRRYWVGRRGVAMKFVVGMGVFLFCAAGLEILINHVHNLLLMHVENVLEEGGEMVGTTIVLWSAVELLAAEKLTFCFDRNGMHIV